MNKKKQKRKPQPPIKKTLVHNFVGKEIKARPYLASADITNKNLPTPINIYNKKHILKSFETKSEDELLKIKETIEYYFKKYMTSIVDMDPALNIYDNEKPMTDVIDFRKHMTQHYEQKSDTFVKKTNDILYTNEPYVFDPAMFWSTNEHFDIIVNDNIKYKCRRIGYSNEYKATQYSVIEYQTFWLNQNIFIEIPTLIYLVQFNTMRVDIPTMTGKYDKQYIPLINGEPCETIDIGKYKNDNRIKNIGENIINTFQNTYGDTFTAIQPTIIKDENLVDIRIRFENCHRQFEKKSYELFIKTIQTIIDNMYVFLFADTYHDILSSTLIGSALFITNYLIKQKKLSKPVKPAKTIKHETEIILENKPERKTRILEDGDSIIEITSDTRPTAPSMDKIIKYHLPEWNRKEHLRHLKSGKIITVKKARCTRRCVDMHGAKSKLPDQATDYQIIKKIKNE